MVLLFAGVFVIYLAVSRHGSVSYDAAVMTAVARALVNHHSLQPSMGGFHDYLHLSTPYAPYGIGLSLVIAPFYILSKATGHEAMVLSVINPMITSATVIIVFAIGRRLGWSRRLAVIGSLTLAISTMVVQYTTELFSEPSVALCIGLIVWGMLRWRAGQPYGALMIGLAAAAAAQFRADSVVTVWVGLLALPLFVPWRSITRARNLAPLVIPMASSLVGLGAYNYLRWHSFAQFSYHGEGYSTPIIHGLDGLILSPNKGLFLFSPIALLGLVGLFVLVRTDRAIGVMFLLLIIPRLLFFARWGDWEGGISWGPRFLEPVVLLMVISAVEVLHRTSGAAVVGVLARVSFGVLCIVGLAVSYLSVRVPYEQWEQVLVSPGRISIYEQGHPFWSSPSPAAIRSATDFTWRASVIPGDIDLLEHGTARMGPALFADGDAVAAWLVLSLGCASSIGALGLAIKHDRAERSNASEEGEGEEEGKWEEAEKEAEGEDAEGTKLEQGDLYRALTGVAPRTTDGLIARLDVVPITLPNKRTAGRRS